MLKISTDTRNRLSGLRSLLRRLRDDHPKYQQILEDYRLREAGIHGEERLKKKLQELRLQIPYTILYDVNLADGEWKVQIDCLIITDRVCIIVEAKNISGKLYFDEETDEFYRINNEGEKKYFTNPHYQVLKHIRFMEHWFMRHNIPVPVTGAAFMTANNSQIVRKPPSYKVYKLEALIERLNEMIANFPNPLLSSIDISQLKDSILFIQSKYNVPPLLEYYDLPKYEIESGVICTTCGQLPMDWKSGWICPLCKSRSKTAHISAIQDYINIFRSSITNKEFRQFCHVKSVFTANRLLKNELLCAHEQRSKRYYTLKESE